MVRRWDDYWNKFKKPEGLSFRMPEMNRWILVSILLTLAVAALAYFHVKTGSYLEVLERNRTELMSNLTICYAEMRSLASDLETCNRSLQSKSLALIECKGERDELNESLDECKEDLDTCEGDYKLLRRSYDRCKDDLDEFNDFLDDNNLDDVDELRDEWKEMKSDLNDCKDDLDACEDNLDTCNDNYDTLLSNYAKDYCCLLNETSGWGNITSYRTSDNRVVCTNSTDDTALVC